MALNLFDKSLNNSLASSCVLNPLAISFVKAMDKFLNWSARLKMSESNSSLLGINFSPQFEQKLAFLL